MLYVLQVSVAELDRNWELKQRAGMVSWWKEEIWIQRCHLLVDSQAAISSLELVITELRNALIATVLCTKVKNSGPII